MSYCDHLLCVVRRRSSVVRRPSTPLKDFSSETPEPIFSKLYVDSSVKGGLKINSNGQGQSIRMAVMPVYGKKTLKNLLQNRILVYSIEDSRSTKIVQMMSVG